MAGFVKRSDPPMIVEQFEEIGLGQWFRNVIGGIEVLAAAAERGRAARAPDQALVTMAELNRANRYDLIADGVERVTGRPAISVLEFVSLNAGEFGGRQF